MNQPYVYVCPLPLEPPSHPILHPTPLGRPKALSWAPCAVHQLRTSYLFYTWQCVCQRRSLSLPHPPLPLVSTWPLSVSASLFLPCREVHQYHFPRFHICVFIYDTCFSDFLHSIWQTLGSSTSLQTTQFRSFLWLQCFKALPVMVTRISIREPGNGIQFEVFKTFRKWLDKLSVSAYDCFGGLWVAVSEMLLLPCHVISP